MTTNNMESTSRKYEADKGNYLLFLIIALLLPGVYIWVLSFQFKELIPYSLLIFVPFLFLLWIYCTTTYHILGNEIFYRSAFLRGTISIGDISAIELVNRPKEGVRPALGSTGMLIYYGTDKCVFLAPTDSKEFLKGIQKINANIKVMRKLSMSQY